MQELKPAGQVQSMLYIDWKNEDNTQGVAFVDRKIAPGTDLYAIPATHRIVPVELLKRIEWVLKKSLYWSNNELGRELCTIIDKEPSP